MSEIPLPKIEFGPPPKHLKPLPPEWVVRDDPAYDPNAFYTRATNKHDHSTVVRVPFPREVVRLMQEVVESGVFPPLRSVNDFIRNAVVHQLHRYADVIPTLRDGLSVERSACVIEQLEERTKSLNEVIARAQQLAHQYVQLEAWELLDELMWKMEEIRGAMPEPWKTKAARLLEHWQTLLQEKIGRMEDGSTEGPALRF